MSVNLTINGVDYAFPQTGESSWGDVVTQWATAVSTGLLQKGGGSFILTSELDFGSSNGLKVLAITSQSSNPASAGFLRLANTQTIAWRNAANDGDMTLQVNASDELEFSGNISGTVSGTISGFNNNRAIISDGSGNLASSTVTSTELGYLAGATSSIQTQITANTVLSAANAVAVALKLTNPMTGIGDMIYDDSGESRLPIGANGQVLTVSGGVPSWGTVAGTGDVVGDTTSNNNALVRFDGATGKIIQNSSVFLDDSNNISGIAGFNQNLLPTTTQTQTIGDGTKQWSRLQLGGSADKGQIWFNTSAQKITCDSSNNLIFATGFNKVDIQTDLEVTGQTTLEDDLDVTGEVDVTGNLTVSGNAPGRQKGFITVDDTNTPFVYVPSAGTKAIEVTVVGGGGGAGGCAATSGSNRAMGGHGGGAGTAIKYFADLSVLLPDAETADSATDVNASFNWFENITDHGFETGRAVQLTTTGTLPGGLSLATTYYIYKVPSVADTFRFCATNTDAHAGNNISLSSTGSGIHTVTPTTSEMNVVAGAGGAGGSNTSSGATGEDSSFGLLMSASGGTGGTGGIATTGPSLIVSGVSGAGTGGDQNFQGGHGGMGRIASNILYPLSTSGHSHFAGGWRYSNSSSNGSDGYAPGGGGQGPCAYSSGQPSRTGGDGGHGVVYIKEYY